MYVCVYVTYDVCANMCMCVRVCVSTCLCVHVYVYVCVGVGVHAHLCLHVSACREAGAPAGQELQGERPEGGAPSLLIAF